MHMALFITGNQAMIIDKGVNPFIKGKIVSFYVHFYPN